MTLTIDGLPGAEIVQEGLADLQAGRQTGSALLLRIAAPRLRPLGIDIPDAPPGQGTSAEHQLYMLLSSDQRGGAHSRYNALLPRIGSFAAAAEHATTR